MQGRKPIFQVRALTIACSDKHASDQFYRVVLGAEPLPTDNGVGYWYRLGTLDITLLTNASEPSPAEFPTHAMPILWLEVDDLDLAKAHFARHKVPVIDPGDGQFMLITDPDRIVIEVWQAEIEE